MCNEKEISNNSSMDNSSKNKTNNAKYNKKKSAPSSSSSKKIKIPVINSYSFVGITPRSIFGCVSCKKRKKKCDEEYPQCGSCKRRGLECQWKNVPLTSSMEGQDKFSISFLHLSQNDLNKKKRRESETQSRRESESKLEDPIKNVDPTPAIITQAPVGKTAITDALPIASDDISNNDLIIIPSNLETRTQPRLKQIPSTTLESTAIINQVPPQPLVQAPEQHIPLIQIPETSVEIDKIEEINHFPETTENSLIPTINNNSTTYTRKKSDLFSLSPLFKSADKFDNLPIFNEFSDNNNYNNNSRGVNEHLDDSIENIAYGLINYLKSPNFEPFNKESDLLITKAINSENNDFPDIDLNYDCNAQKYSYSPTQKISPIVRQPPPIRFEFDEQVVEEDDEEEEGVHALDESQMVENNYYTEEELLNVSLNALKSRTGLKYFKPAFQLLFNPTQLTAKSPINFKLDDTSRLFLDHYVNYVVKTITCVSPNNSRNNDFNYFSNFLLRMAMSDESQILLNGLVAWGGMFLIGNKNPYSKKLLQNSLNVVQERLSASPNLSNEEFLKILSFYIIGIGSNISTGDTVDWFILFKQFKVLIDSYGGSKKFLRDNSDATGARWMIAYLYSHDISNSSAMINGTLMKLNEYKELINDNTYQELMYSDVDPLMGWSQSLYIVFGEIVNKSSELRKLRMTKEYRDNELQFKQLVNDTFYDLQNKIIKCELNTSLMTDFFNDMKQLEAHVILFELLQLQLLIIIRISIKETSFDDVQLQKLCNDLNKRIDFLIGSQVQSAMAFSFLIGGILNIDHESREKTRKRYQVFKDNYPVVNLVRAWDIILEVWKRLDRLMIDMSDESFQSLRDEIGESEEFTDIVLLVEETMLMHSSSSRTTNDSNQDFNIQNLNNNSTQQKRKKIFVDWVEVANDFGWDVCLI